jgi:hypothetical protein
VKLGRRPALLALVVAGVVGPGVALAGPGLNDRVVEASAQRDVGSGCQDMQACAWDSRHYGGNYKLFFYPEDAGMGWESIPRVKSAKNRFNNRKLEFAVLKGFDASACLNPGGERPRLGHEQLGMKAVNVGAAGSTC